MRGLSEDSMRKMVDLDVVGTFIDDTAVVGQIYFYSVAAINKAGTGTMTEPFSIKIPEPDTPPSRVPRLDLTLDGTSVTLEWSRPLDDGGSPVTGYVVLRGPSPDDLEEVAEVGPGVTSWTDEGLEKGTTYHYSVYARNAVGDGEPIETEHVNVPKPKEKEDSPGFEVILIAMALLLILPVARRRC
jgi:titin